MELSTDIKKQIKGRLRNFESFGKINRLKSKVNLDYCIKVLTEIGKEKCPQFRIDQANKFTFENLIYWLHNDDRCLSMEVNQPYSIKKADLNKGFYIFGSTGTGKSVALEVIKAYAAIMQINVELDFEEKIMFWENHRTIDICTKFAKIGNYEFCTKPKILGLQDLGSEEKETLYMGNRINVIQQILETRGDANDNLTFITSNLPMNFEVISKRYNDRVASRLQEMCNFYVLGGKDRRIPK